jgi:selenocysteine-specific elongation factor
MMRLSGHKIALQADQKDMRHKIEQAYLKAGLQPPSFKELVASTGQNSGHMEDVLGHMLDDGVLIKVKEGLYFHKIVIKALKDRLVSFLQANGEITTPQLKEITGVSRKYMIPLIEYFDDTKVTIRVGDVRRLREG